jgi:hypothetical protein
MYTIYIKNTINKLRSADVFELALKFYNIIIDNLNTNIVLVYS